MFAKMSAKNQITLPKAVLMQVAPTDVFKLETVNDRIILTPVRMQKADAVRSTLAALGISQQDVSNAIAWARRDWAGRAAPRFAPQPLSFAILAPAELLRRLAP